MLSASRVEVESLKKQAEDLQVPLTGREAKLKMEKKRVSSLVRWLGEEEVQLVEAERNSRAHQSMSAKYMALLKEAKEQVAEAIDDAVAKYKASTSFEEEMEEA